MQYYFAPLEGITDSIYRQLHNRFFPGIDKYFTPFLSPTVHRSLTPRESRELPFADTLDFCVVPQLLTKNPEDFLWMAQQCADRGYKEVNLNLGCPSGTVTAKGKGSGMLQDLQALANFLDAVFANPPIEISIKTRIGFDSGGEFPALVEIFNCYPIKELTIHPRARSSFYKGAVDMDAFRYAAQNCRMPLCYNGDLFSKMRIEQIVCEFPSVSAVMVGRGLIGDPGMLTSIADSSTLEAFYDALLEAYIIAFGSERNAMFRLKEHWYYLCGKFDAAEKLTKRIRKTTSIDEFRSVTKQILHTCPMRETLQANW